MSRQYFIGGYYGIAGGYASTDEDRDYFLSHGYVAVPAIDAEVSEAAGTATGVGAATAQGQIVEAAAAAGIVGSFIGKSIGGVIVAVEEVSEAVANADGVGTAVAIGTGINSANASVAAGVGAAAATATAITAAVGTAAGISDATAQGRPIGAGAGLAAGVGAATGASSATLVVAGDGAASGVGAAAAISTGIVRANASVAAGTGAATAQGFSTGAGAGDADGVGVATGVGTAIRYANASTAAGVGAATAPATGFVGRTGTAAGTSNAASTGMAIFSGRGDASGVGVASTFGTNVKPGVGSSAGVGAAASISFYFENSASVIKPDADDTDGGWLNELGSATNLFASINEIAPQDTNYIISSDRPVADVCKIRVGNPSGNILMPFGVLYRFKKQGGDPINLRVRLLEGSTEIAAWTHNGIAAEFLTVEQMLTAPQFAAITDPTNLFFEFRASV